MVLGICSHFPLLMNNRASEMLLKVILKAFGAYLAQFRPYWKASSSGAESRRIRGFGSKLLRVREHPLVTESTLSNLKKSFMKRVVMLKGLTQLSIRFELR